MDWKNMPTLHKIATVIAAIAAVIIVAKPAILPFDLTYPAIAVLTVCEAVVYWEKKRKWAYLLLAGAAISMAFFLLEFLW